MLTGLATTFQGVVSWSGFLKAYSASRDWIESQATHPGRRGGKGSGERSNRPSRFACCVERGPARGAVNAAVLANPAIAGGAGIPAFAPFV